MMGKDEMNTEIRISTSWSTKPDLHKMQKQLDDDIELSVAPEYNAEVASGHLLHGKEHIL